MNLSLTNSDKGFLRRLLSPDGYSGLKAFGRNDQITYVSLTALAVFTLSLARWLKPSPNGFGTHQQLGLPPCLFFKLTGVPCPNCGLTTSFAHAARLHVYQAFTTQPFGLLAFCLTVVSIPLFVILFQQRIAWADIIHARGVDRMLYFLVAVYLLSWVYKVVAIKWLLS